MAHGDREILLPFSFQHQQTKQSAAIEKDSRMILFAQKLKKSEFLSLALSYAAIFYYYLCVAGTLDSFIRWGEENYNVILHAPTWFRKSRNSENVFAGLKIGFFWVIEKLLTGGRLQQVRNSSPLSWHHLILINHVSRSLLIEISHLKTSFIIAQGTNIFFGNFSTVVVVDILLHTLSIMKKHLTLNLLLIASTTQAKKAAKLFLF